MGYELDTSAEGPSTTWIPKPDRMRGSRRGATQNGSQRPKFRSLRPRNPRERLTVTIRYRAGAEAWWLIEGRGTVQAFPGHLSLHDVFSALNGQGPIHARVHGVEVES